MNSAIRVRAEERNRRIFFPSEQPVAAPSRGGLLHRLRLAAQAALGLRG